MTSTTYDRIDSLDLIRGTAILAIPLMNIFGIVLPPLDYFVPTWKEGSGTLDMAIYVFQVLFVESRFMSIFTMLFGVDSKTPDGRRHWTCCAGPDSDGAARLGFACNRRELHGCAAHPF